MKNEKKAFVEVQFNWIFILVAGGLILFFFISLISKQSKIAETSSNIDSLEYIDKILSGTSMEVGTTRNITINNLNVKVTESLITLPNKKVEGKSLRNKIVFAPDLIKGNKLITHSLYWEIPYKTTPFLYLTSNEVRYILMNDTISADDDDLINRAYALLPEFTAKEIIPLGSLAQLEEKNNYEVRLIFFNREPPQIRYAIDSENLVTALNIIKLDDSADIDGYGRVNFYRREGTVFVLKNSAFYLKKETLLGAIVTDTPEYYQENMRKAFVKLNAMTNILIIKTTRLNELSSATPGSKCPDIYTQILPALLSINDITKNMQMTQQSFSTIYQNSKYIELYQGDLERESCPYLY